MNILHYQCAHKAEDTDRAVAEVYKKEPVYKVTNRGLEGIGCQWLPMATNNLVTDYQWTIMALT